MTNKERQKSLDKKKWLESEKKGKDMSGYMEQCHMCDECEIVQGYKDGNPHLSLRCKASQEEREQKCLCATAYNRMYRKEK